MLKRAARFCRPRAFLVRYPPVIVWASVAFTIVVFAMVLAVLAQSRHDAALRATENAENLVSVLEHDITHTAELTDLSIQTAVDGVENADVMRLPERDRREILFDKSTAASRNIGSLIYLNAAGKIIIDSGHSIPATVNLADRQWFAVHRTMPLLGLYVSEPMRSRLNDGEVNIMFSRRVNGPDGSFAGVVVAALRLDYFKDLLSRVNLGPGAMMTLVQSDGHVILHYPYQQGASVDDNLNGRKNFQRFKKTNETSFFATSGLDGESRLYVFRRLENLPMMIVVAPASRYIFADWARRAWYTIITAVLLSAGLIWTAWLLSLEFQHRLKVEAELRTMTAIDGLTGLSNRRRLDECLMLQWRSSLRTGKPLSLLFVDIDRFKSYNDAYGHQAGDDVLTAVAQAIARGTRRPSDVAARFGGEEFVVLLPETDSYGASLVATDIHLAVSALAIRHVDSEYGVVTVSIGLACNAAADVLDALALLRLADDAVYRAKASGRNRTAIADPLDRQIFCA
jgi:diguanylate cyclase (GGDEF)-like protein